MFIDGGFGAAHQVGGQVLSLHVVPFPLGLRLRRGQVGDAQSGHVPGAALQETGDTVFVHHVAVFDAVSAEPDGGFHRPGVGGVGHDRHGALAAQIECRLQLLGQQERVQVPVPMGTHNAAGQVQLDVVYAVFDLLADGFHEPVGAVALPCVAGGQEMAAGGGEEIAAGEDSGPLRPSRLLEGAFPGHVHEVPGAGAAH